MRALGIEVSAYGVAELYKDFLDMFIIDNVDRSLKDCIKSLGIKAIVTNTIMKSIEDQMRLAKIVISEVE